MQIIYKRYRADSKWGRKAVKYPAFKNKMYIDQDGYMEYERIDCHVWNENVVQINTEHSCVRMIKERIYNNINLEEP